MNYQEVEQEVLNIVKRPDKIGLIRTAINRAVRHFSMGTNFAQDMSEDLVSIDPNQYAHALDLGTLTRFRTFAYIRPSNRNCYVTQCDPGAIFQKGKEQLDKYYIAGTQANLKLAVLASSLQVGWFKYPPVLNAGSSAYWMLDVCPYMVIDKAAASVFKEIGDDASATKKEQEAKEQYAVAVADLRYGGIHYAG